MSTSAINSTPIQPSYAGRKEYQQLIENAKKAQEEHGRQMLEYWIGPLDPARFLSELMPCYKAQLDKRPTNVKFELPVRTAHKLEKHIYQLFDETIKTHKLSPCFMSFIGAPSDHGYRMRGKKHNLKIDDLGPKDVKEETAREALDWSQDNLVVEFKKSSEFDPFFTKKELEGKVKGTVIVEGDKPLLTFAKMDEGSERIRGQLSTYATEVFDHQHRTHIFQFLVCGRRARFLFWDHSGAIVSDAFDYMDDCKLLAEFFWRYNYMSPEARGLDTTVQYASFEEQDLFHTQVKSLLTKMNDPNNPQRKLPRAERTMDPSFPVHKVTVVDDLSGNSEDVLIQAPFVRNHTALGRATRGYLAYVIKREEFKFLKDTWRAEHSHLIPERTLCQQLKEAQTPSVPTEAFGGDVSSNKERARTRCREWAKEQELNVLVADIKNFHQPKISQELAYPVETASNSYEFVWAFRDCIDAIEAAYERCNLLHRDISIGNVMIRGDRTVRGILTDWDHATSVIALEGSSYLSFRTGTWQFMSVGLLKNPDKAHTIIDEFESLFWSLLYGSLHNFEHNANQDFPMGMFDEYEDMKRGDKLVRVGGRAKSDALREMKGLVTFKCPPLNDLIQRLAREFSAYYTLMSQAMGEPAHTQDAELVEGDLVELSRPEPALSEDDADHSEEDDIGDAQGRFEERQKKLSQPSFWSRIFDKALKRKKWTKDRVEKDRYAASTAKEKSQNATKSQLSSYHTGAQLASGNVELARYLRDLHRQGKAKAEADEYANMLSDADDGKESCIDERDHKERVDNIDAEFPPIMPSEGLSHPPVSAPRSPANAANPDVPPLLPMGQTTSLPNFPPSSFSMPAGHGVGSSRLKRSIDEVAPDVSSQPIDPTAEGRATKKSRARTKVRAEPSDRVTRSSSRKSASRSTIAAAPATETKKEKETRPWRTVRKAQSGDLDTARPRREGLRPRPTKSTMQ